MGSTPPGAASGHKAPGGLPAYRRILEEIRLRIESGALRPGDRVDSERNLAAQYAVSLMTARHAINELEKEGFVLRRVGAGTFVAPPKIHFNRLLSFSEQMAGRGLAAVSKVVAVRAVEGDMEIAARLGLPAGARLLKLERIRFGGGEPLAFETSHLSYDEFPKVAQTARTEDSLFHSLERHYNLRPSYADEEVDATTAGGSVADYLQIPRGSAVLRIRQVLYAASGRKLLYDVGLYRAERHSLTIRRFR